MQFSRLRAGDVVAVVAPGSAVDPDCLERGLRELEGLGFRPRLGAHVATRIPYLDLAGSDDARRADLQAALDDTDVAAVMCARGGYGCQRILRDVDLSGLRRRPKPVIGYSDVSPLLQSIVRGGLVAVHGPMVGADLARGLTPRSRDHLLSLLTDPTYLWTMPVPEPVRPGRAEGRLVGGCLAVLVSTLGTTTAPDWANDILFLEDIGEKPYELDRMLVQARQAGWFDRIAGVVFGTMEACDPADGVSPLDVARNFFANAYFPVGFGIAAGHRRGASDVEQMALPLGTRVALDVDAGTLSALEPAAKEAA